MLRDGPENYTALTPMIAAVSSRPISNTVPMVRLGDSSSVPARLCQGNRVLLAAYDAGADEVRVRRDLPADTLRRLRERLGQS